MTDDHTNTHNDPKLAQTESLLEQLAQQDRDATPSGMESRVLDAIGRAIAPPPLVLSQPIESNSPSRIWSLRYAAAALLATGATLTIVATQPWASNGVPSEHTIALASFEQDLDAFFELESMDDGNLSEAVTEWEIWAQSLDTDIDSSLDGYDWDDLTLDDGAL